MVTLQRSTRVFGAGLFVGLPAALSLASCGDLPERAEDPIAVTLDPLGGSGATINRVIPLRFIQLTASANTKLSDAALQEDIDGANLIFAPAGIRFFLRASHEVVDNPSATFSSLDGNYVWPSPTSLAPPLAIFNPTCNPPAPPTGSEHEHDALARIGAYCAINGEVTVFLNGNWQGEGYFPWQGNSVLMRPDHFVNPICGEIGERTFAHELGHYFGLPHSFRGGNFYADLGDNVVNPETGAQGVISDYWDLVYKPANLPPVGSSNRYFVSRADAQSVPAWTLLPIQGNAGWNYPTLPELGFGCTSTIPGFACSGKPEGTLRLAVPFSDSIYNQCNVDNDGSTCLCATNPSNCDVLYTGDPGLKGLGIVMPGHAQPGINVMSYNYDPGFNSGTCFPGLYAFDEAWLSASQLEQISRVLRFDIASTSFTGTTGRRPWLGTGRGTWADWESLGGGVLGTPAATVNSAGKLDVIVRGTGGNAYNKVYNPGSGWWPSQTGWNSLGGTLTDSPVAQRRGDYFDVFALDAAGAWNKVWDPGLSGWWPSQTGWSWLGAASTRPAAASWSTGRVDLVSRGSSGNAVYKFWDSSTGVWSPSQTTWTDLGGTILGAPSIATWGVGHLDVVVIGTNGAAWNKAYNASTGWWPTLGWHSLGSRQFAETPTIVSFSSSQVDLVGRGTDGKGYNKFWTPSGLWWPSETGWQDIGGCTSEPCAPGESLAGPISAVSWGVGRLDIAARGTKNELLYKYWDSSIGTWWPSQYTWASLAVDIAGDPVIVTSGVGELDFFVRGSDGAIWHRSRTP